MIKGFRDFILRGNVMDLAVAVIIGAAFAAIITSLVKDIITPLIAAIVGKPDFSGIVGHVNGTPIFIGNFINATITFVLLAAVVYFLLVKPTEYLIKRFVKPVDTPVATKPCPQCLSDIPLAARRCKFCAEPIGL